MKKELMELVLEINLVMRRIDKYARGVCTT